MSEEMIREFARLIHKQNRINNLINLKRLNQGAFSIPKNRKDDNNASEIG